MHCDDKARAPMSVKSSPYNRHFRHAAGPASSTGHGMSKATEEKKAAAGRKQASRTALRRVSSGRTRREGKEKRGGQRPLVSSAQHALSDWRPFAQRRGVQMGALCETNSEDSSRGGGGSAACICACRRGRWPHPETEGVPGA